MIELRIHTNAPVNAPAYLLDRNGDPVLIDPTATLKLSVKKSREDASPLLTFQSGGGSGLGEISLTTEADEDGITRDYLVFTAPQPLVANIAAGAYFADLLQGPDWELELKVLVLKGITPP